jgi:hypothetical protein
VADIEAADLLIADAGADPLMLRELRSKGLGIDVVQPVEGVATKKN